MRKKRHRMIEAAERQQEREEREEPFNGKQKKEFRHQVVVSAMTEGQKKYIVEIKNNDIVFCSGPAGSGKTAVAVGMALQYICAEQPAFEKIVVLRPAKEACDEKIGYLPGNLEEKMSPYAAPIFDNMEVFIDKARIKNLVWENKIEIVPIAFARGRSFNKSFILVDEGQNCTEKQLLLILTRLGKGSKMCVNGDLKQSDLKTASGLIDAIRRLQGIDGISFVRLDETDIVRHPLVAEIVKRYEDPLPAERPAA